MKEIADKLNSMDGVKVIGQMANLDPDVFLGRYWIQFTCDNKESIDFILHACTGANVICKIEEGWGNEESPIEKYVYTLIIQDSRLEPFKCFMGMPYRVTGGIQPILAKDVSWIKDLMPQEEPEEEPEEEQDEGLVFEYQEEVPDKSFDYELVKIVLCAFGMFLLLFSLVMFFR